MFDQTLFGRTAIASLSAFFLLACGPGEGPDEPDDSEPAAGAEAPGELLAGEVERDTDPDVDADTFAEFTADNRDFAFAMFDELRADEGSEENVFVSPHSISSALAMTYEGADGNTRAEMAEALRFGVGDDALHPAFNLLDLELASRSEIEAEEDEKLELEVVNQTWGQQGYPFYDDYLDVLALHYGAGLYAVDFQNNFEEIREGINAWVEEQTQGHIDDLLPEGGLNEWTRMVLVNAIYFYGSWDDPFYESLTEEQSFRTISGSETDVDMMRHLEPTSAGYFDGADSTAVSLPYVGGDVAMIAVMPGEEGADFASWEDDFDRQAFDEVVGGLETQEGYVRLPKFEDEGDFDLIPPFEQLGMEDAFDEGLADFGRMADLEESMENLFITGIFHQTFIGVDEEGTEAAAATAVVGGSQGEPVPDFEVTFDRPFYYTIYDHGTDSILFMGRMVDPS